MHIPGRLDRPALTLLAAILAFALVRALLAATAGLTEDEAYYRLWALAPALSYLDHPPMTGWLIAAGRLVAGDTPLGLRLAAVLTSLVGPLVLWRSAAILFGDVVARRAVWLALAMPLLAAGGIVITPDTPSALFWGLAGWALAELSVARTPHWWLAVGLFAGLGLLSKYTNLFVGAGIVLWLLATPENRRWLAAWQLWAGGVLAGVLALPVLVWNMDHGWASFGKQLGRVARGSQFTPVYLLELAGGFLGLASPVIAVLAVAGLWQVTRRALAGRHPPSLLLATGALPLLAYFLVHALHARVQPNWLAPIYPALAICAALALGARSEAGARTLFRWALGIGLALTALLYVHALRPLVPALAARDPTAQMRGWPAFAAEVEAVRRASGACWVATSNYATTGLLAYHLPANVPALQLNERLRYIHLPPPDAATLACPAVYVELARRADPALLARRFARVTPLPPLARRDRGVTLGDYTLFLLAEPRGSPLGD